MPASLPGDNTLNNFGNPNAGRFVIFDALSGPKGSPLDYDGVTLSYDYATSQPVYTVGDPQHVSTGGLSTGIGFGSPPIIGLTAPDSIKAAGFTDDYKPGISTVVPADATTSKYMYIGGGCSVTSGSPSYANPAGQQGAPGWTAGFGIAGAGNGGSRDSGANTGFGMKTVTATGDVANGAAVEAGYINRSGVEVKTGQSVFGSASAALAAAVKGTYVP